MEDLGDFLDDETRPGDERAHSDLGASAAERWMNCEKSVQNSRGMPNKSSIFAMEGTAAHTLSELCLKNEISPYAFDGKFISYKGEIYDDMPDDVDFNTNPVFEINNTDENSMIRAVSVYLNFVEQRREEIRKLYKEDPILLIEQRFDLSSVYPGMFGTNDVGLYIPSVYLEAADYKHGRGKVVEIKNNAQLKYYGLGGLVNLCETEFDEPEKVVTTVIQPRAKHSQGPIRTAEYPSELLRVQFAGELVAAAKRTEAPDAKETLGAWCFFCRGKINCNEWGKRKKELTTVDHYDLTEDELADPAPVVAR